MNIGNIIQIDAPDFDPDIDDGLPTKEHQETQGLDSPIQQPPAESDKCNTPALPHELQKKWIGRMQYQSRSHHNQTRMMRITYQYYHQDMRQILVKYLNWRVI